MILPTATTFMPPLSILRFAATFRYDAAAYAISASYAAAAASPRRHFMLDRLSNALSVNITLRWLFSRFAASAKMLFAYDA